MAKVIDIFTRKRWVRPQPAQARNTRHPVRTEFRSIGEIAAPIIGGLEVR